MRNQNQAKYVATGTGPAFWGPGDQITFLLTGAETGGAFFLAECAVAPQGGPPPHIHHREDESIFVMDGTVTFQVDGTTLRASAGDLVYIPRGTVHGFQNTGATRAKLLVLATPAGLENFFAEAFVPAPDRFADPPSVDQAIFVRLMEAAPRHGLEILFPAPAEQGS